MNLSAFKLAALAVAWVFGGGGAWASVVTESEPNNSLLSAQQILNTDSSISITGQRSFNDPSDDFFSFEVRRGGSLSIRSSSPDGAADSVMGLFDAAGVLVASNDDGTGIGFMSAIDFVVPDNMLGRYTLGFSGFNPGLIACTPVVTQCYDSDGNGVFDTFVSGGGAGGSTGWEYGIQIQGAGLSVPEPGSLALVIVALLAAGTTRRRRRADATSLGGLMVAGQPLRTLRVPFCFGPA